MITVELSPAYVFDCDSCGRETFQRAVSRFLDPTDPGEASIIKMAHGLDENDDIPDGYVCRAKTMPKKVVCSYCGETFAALDIEPDSAGEVEGG